MNYIEWGDVEGGIEGDRVAVYRVGQRGGIWLSHLRWCRRKVHQDTSQRT